MIGYGAMVRCAGGRTEPHKGHSVNPAREKPLIVPQSFLSSGEPLVGSRPGCVESMPARGAETERLHPVRRDLGRVDLREPEGPHALRAELKEQLLQTGSTPSMNERSDTISVSSIPRLR